MSQSLSLLLTPSSVASNSLRSCPLLQYKERRAALLYSSCVDCGKYGDGKYYGHDEKDCRSEYSKKESKKKGGIDGRDCARIGDGSGRARASNTVFSLQIQPYGVNVGFPILSRFCALHKSGGDFARRVEKRKPSQL